MTYRRFSGDENRSPPTPLYFADAPLSGRNAFE
jgi:hypothetical protein